MPKKIILAGTYLPLAPELSKLSCQEQLDQAKGMRSGTLQPQIMLFDRSKHENSVTKPFQSKGLISSLVYGPYDNGHILVGLTTGDFFAFDSMNLTMLVNVKISESPVTSIAVEPTQLVLVGCKAD